MRSPLARWLWLWGPPAGFMTALFWASSQPDLTAMPGGISDKTAHFAAFFVLGALCLRGASGGRWSGIRPSSMVAAFAIAAGYGALDEVHQMLTPGRFPSAADWVADALGAATAVAAGRVAAALVPRMRSNRDV